MHTKISETHAVDRKYVSPDREKHLALLDKTRTVATVGGHRRAVTSAPSFSQYYTSVCNHVGCGAQRGAAPSQNVAVTTAFPLRHITRPLPVSVSHLSNINAVNLFLLYMYSCYEVQSFT